MESKHFQRIGETVYSAELPNGLQLRVSPQEDFARSFAVVVGLLLLTAAALMARKAGGA